MMQTDVLASAVRTTDGVMNDQAGNAIGRCRVKGVYIVPSSLAGSVILKDGSTAGSTNKITINTIAGSTSTAWILMPGEGLLFQSGIFADLTDAASVMVLYG
ncbi:hypothetical protein UFOVP1302_18 [uncultured Caudovirales phage]|uniref:Uncharacterized protein n=1 Tax=uncultured Caudovirales phage TaxID=2100421 RepID=A0A6J5PC72_9CAUD|nr:hypothetical protein UFOVP895_21 [uncultured Caudovirales phage]CAB4181792.1 hypothetical protein UFOVP1070_66 [uncultured Caudovirales phage]CAB4195549.1 hypothetical protein UFOVP1302_18 [uncultured Caudovirales phage]CAB4211667.1 hypothetical protein UFOVP1416_14 [uncultured Caudovirales phage]